MTMTEDAQDARQLQATAENIELPVNSLPLFNLGAGRAAMLEYFDNTWGLTEQLFSALVSEEAYLMRPYHKTRHPLIFYYAHPVCFYVNKLLVSGLIEKPVNQEFELLFETGVDEMNWDDLHDGENDVWPALDAVKEYRQQVYELVRDVIQNHPDLDGPISMSTPGWGLVMAFEHERIHLETSSVLMRELPIEFLQKPKVWPQWLSAPEAQNHNPEPGNDYPDNEFIELSDGSVKLGKPQGWPSFGWDNEYGSDEREYAAFKASKYLISNGEFFQFVKSGGYEQKKYWSESAWGWRQFRNIKWPTFWLQDGPAGSHRYKLRTTFEEIPMQWSWPAVVNYYEAKAYCAWLTEQDSSKLPYRLLQEAEHHALREPAIHKAIDWSLDAMELLNHDAVMNAIDSAAETAGSSANHNLRYGGESAVDALPANSLGFHDSFGNVWQWCEDPFHPLPEFNIHPYYTDFSSPCFDGEHQMILGGSFISTGDEASIWSRFHFRPHFFQHAGFRVVQDYSVAEKKGDKYDTDSTVSQYLLFHYGEHAEQRDAQIAQTVDFPQVGDLIMRTVELTNTYSGSNARVLDLGCAVGRASFELARNFQQVVGLDYSDAFVDVAEKLRVEKSMAYQRWDTGRHFTELNASIDSDIDCKRIDFVQGDASYLSGVPLLQDAQAFDAVLLSNLLCRLSNPQECLQQFVESDQYLDSGGILVIASPNTWMAEYTDAERFLDGADNEGTLAAIGKQLPNFELLHNEDLPFMIREHRRKYEYIISQVSVWKKP